MFAHLPRRQTIRVRLEPDSAPNVVWGAAGALWSANGGEGR
jgi:hypothetical protein